MTTYVLLNSNDELLRTRDFAEGEEVPVLSPAKNMRWVVLAEAPALVIAAVEAAIAAALVPEFVLMRQAQYALLYAGMLDTVETFLEAIPDATEKRAAQIEWRASATVRRDNALVTAAGAVLGLTEAQLDDLFIFARTIP